MPNPEFFICHMIDGAPAPKEVLERWPLHMTVAPPFWIPSETIINEVLECISEKGRGLDAIKLSYGEIRAGAIPLEIGHAAMFGEYNDIGIRQILDPSGELHKLHSSLILELGRIGCGFKEYNPAWNMENYSPHATAKSGKELTYPFFCTNLSLCKKDETGKSVVDTVNLCKKSQ